MPEPGNPTAFAPIIHSYTRAQAIEDGILVDVSDTAREAGFTIPGRGHAQRLEPPGRFA